MQLLPGNLHHHCHNNSLLSTRLGSYVRFMTSLIVEEARQHTHLPASQPVKYQLLSDHGKNPQSYSLPYQGTNLSCA